MQYPKISRHQKSLGNPHPVAGARYPYVEVTSTTHGNYHIEGRILPVTNKPLSTMVIHGARSDFTKGDALFIKLHNLGTPLLNATVSGHGIAGHQTDTPFSLDDNLQEAQAFAQLLEGDDKTIIGASMGGTTAVRLIQKNPGVFNKLVLFYPAVFTDEVYTVPFGTDRFRTIASKKKSFIHSSFFDVIRDFPGKIMLIKGEFDGLNPQEYDSKDPNAVFTTHINGREVYSPIAPEVFENIRKLRPDTEYIEVPGVDHKMMSWFKTHENEADLLAKRLLQFID